jgi:hypothetical protein
MNEEAIAHAGLQSQRKKVLLCNSSITLYHIYVCYMNITFYIYIIYIVTYYLWFHVTMERITRG